MNFINEGYKEIDELNLLATEIINDFVNTNLDIINSSTTDKIKSPLYNSFNINEDVLNNNTNKFKIIKDFLNNLKYKDINVVFILSNTNGAKFHNESNLIEVFYDKDDYQYYMENYINKNNLNKETITKIFKVLLQSSLIHELQHAIDNFKSNGKYMSDKKSKKYYHNKLNWKNNITRETLYNQYLKLPHEYWARFTEYIVNTNPIAFKKVKFDELLSNFKNSNIIKYNNLNNNDKKKLIKALYKYWHLKNLS